MRIILIFISVLILIGKLEARSPSNPYNFYYARLNNMLPFTEVELLVIKQNKIKTISQIEKKSYGYFEVVYTFNEFGNLLKEESYYYKKIRGKSNHIIEYRYYYDGRLKAISEGGECRSYDSLVYDINGRIFKYLSYSEYYIKKGKWAREWNCELELVSVKPNVLEYVDKLDSLEEVRYYYDSLYNIQKRTSGNDLDSVAIKKVNEDEYSKIYYTRNSLIADIRVGQEFRYKADRLVEFIQYNMVCNPPCVNVKTYYEYDRNGKMILTYNENSYQRKYVYIYGTLGLKTEEIEVDENETRIKKYYYTY